MRANINRAGMSLIELTMAVGIFGTVAAVAGQSMVSGVRLNQEVAESSQAIDDTNRVLQRIAGQLRSADYSWIYLNQDEVSTYTFRVCTGLGVSSTGEIGPQFDQTYTIAFDSKTGILTATLVDQKTGKVLGHEIARGLWNEGGFRIGQLGTDVLVKGNRLQLTMARPLLDVDGKIVYDSSSKAILREATTTIFLRSTIYANTNLTTTVTSTTPTNPTNPTTPTNPTDPTKPSTGTTPVLTLGADTDVSTKSGSIKDVNCLQIVGTVGMPNGATDTLNTNTFDARFSKASDGIEASLVINRGWIPGEVSNNSSLKPNEFKISGWVKGSLTVTIAMSSAAGAVGTITKSY